MNADCGGERILTSDSMSGHLLALRVDTARRQEERPKPKQRTRSRAGYRSTTSASVLLTWRDAVSARIAAGPAFVDGE